MPTYKELGSTAHTIAETANQNGRALNSIEKSEVRQLILQCLEVAIEFSKDGHVGTIDAPRRSIEKDITQLRNAMQHCFLSAEEEDLRDFATNFITGNGAFKQNPQNSALFKNIVPLHNDIFAEVEKTLTDEVGQLKKLHGGKTIQLKDGTIVGNKNPKSTIATLAAFRTQLRNKANKVHLEKDEELDMDELTKQTINEYVKELEKSCDTIAMVGNSKKGAAARIDAILIAGEVLSLYKINPSLFTGSNMDDIAKNNEAVFEIIVDARNDLAHNKPLRLDPYEAMMALGKKFTPTSVPHESAGRELDDDGKASDDDGRPGLDPIQSPNLNSRSSPSNSSNPPHKAGAIDESHGLAKANTPQASVASPSSASAGSSSSSSDSAEQGSNPEVERRKAALLARLEELSQTQKRKVAPDNKEPEQQDLKRLKTEPMVAQPRAEDDGHPKAQGIGAAHATFQNAPVEEARQNRAGAVSPQSTPATKKQRTTRPDHTPQ